MKLKGKVTIVAGGTGNIGEGIVRAHLNQGATVIVPSRTLSRVNALQGYVSDSHNGNLVPFQTNVGTFAGAQEFVRDVLENYGKIDLCVASLGGWWHGKTLTEISNDEWNEVMQTNLNPHFYMARAVLPAMEEAKSGTYVMIAGPGGIVPAKRSEVIAVAGTAQMKMAEVLHAGMKPFGVKVYQLFVADIATPRQGREATETSITPDEIGEYTVKLHFGDVKEPQNYVQKFMRANLPWFKV
jgi:NAD(P)-dependent dehydrogenase (short-subunit alcohol dehydrogenase family)